MTQIKLPPGKPGRFTLRLWGRDGREQARFEGHTEGVTGALLWGEHVLSWSADRTLRLWGRDGGELARFEGHTGWIKGALLWGEQVLSWGHDRTLRLWGRDGRLIETAVLALPHEDYEVAGLLDETTFAAVTRSGPVFIHLNR